jgi:hypothetical protein
MHVRTNLTILTKSVGGSKVGQIFENQANGYRESVGGGDIAGAFLLGPLWYLRRGLYAIGAIDLSFYILIIIGMSSGNDNTAGALFFLCLVPAHIIGALASRALISRHFARLGWREIIPDTPDSVKDEKLCPMCAETVKAAALICKHCGHHFPEATP